MRHLVVVAIHSSHRHPVKLLKCLQITHLLRTIHRGVGLVHIIIVVVIIHSNGILTGAGTVVHTREEMVLTITIMATGAIKTEEIMIGMVLEIIVVETPTCNLRELFQGLGALHRLLVHPPLCLPLQCDHLVVQWDMEVS